jgi:hypothetical protein
VKVSVPLHVPVFHCAEPLPASAPVKTIVFTTSAGGALATTVAVLPQTVSV